MFEEVTLNEQDIEKETEKLSKIYGKDKAFILVYAALASFINGEYGGFDEKSEIVEYVDRWVKEENDKTLP